MKDYISLSLELHLFFARIMKEHALFLEAGFLAPDEKYKQKSEYVKQQFEALLEEVVCISDGSVRCCILESGEIVTDFTLEAEQKTEKFTGIDINSHITKQEKKIRGISDCCAPIPVAKQKVSRLNQKAICLLDEIICLKEHILQQVLKCEMFTANYPLLIEHIIREAKLYLCYTKELEETETICPESVRELEIFWDQIMMEHALFIRGLLDPSEVELIKTADNFAETYRLLLQQAWTSNNRMIEPVASQTIDETIKYRDFKKAGTIGINECKIKSIILPLLADHVLREANHYLRILGADENQ